MSVAPALDPTTDAPPVVEPAERGSLTIQDRVVQRVAAHAAATVPHAAAAPRRVLGVSVGSARPDERAQVSAQVYGDTATVQAMIAVAWPQPVAEVAEQLRRRVRDEVRRVTGVLVDQIDVEVTSLDIPTEPPPRVR